MDFHNVVDIAGGFAALKNTATKWQLGLQRLNIFKSLLK